MLKRVRIEVEEETAEKCVEALWKYEHAIVQQEVRRYRHRWPLSVIADLAPIEGRPGEPLPELDSEAGAEEYPTPDQPWDDSVAQRWWYNDQLGREVHEEVIEFDESLPGYRGRRVVHFVRLDTRSGLYFELTSHPQLSATIESGNASK